MSTAQALQTLKNLIRPMSSKTATTMQTSTDSNEFISPTRFGEVTLHHDKLITFPQGLFGFADCTTFGLSQVPGQPNSPMLLLHCPARPEVTFVVADPQVLGLGFEQVDIDAALVQLGYPNADTQVLVILTIYKTEESASITANLRAPLFVDTGSQRGVQFILPNSSYNTQHKI